MQPAHMMRAHALVAAIVLSHAAACLDTSGCTVSTPQPLVLKGQLLPHQKHLGSEVPSTAGASSPTHNEGVLSKSCGKPARQSKKKVSGRSASTSEGRSLADDASLPKKRARGRQAGGGEQSEYKANGETTLGDAEEENIATIVQKHHKDRPGKKGVPKGDAHWTRKADRRKRHSSGPVCKACRQSKSKAVQGSITSFFTGKDTSTPSNNLAPPSSQCGGDSLGCIDELGSPSGAEDLGGSSTSDSTNGPILCVQCRKPLEERRCTSPHSVLSPTSFFCPVLRLQHLAAKRTPVVADQQV